ncbi:MAG: hypothetical protein ACOYLO_00660 [Ferruginibacter sp.]
MKKILCYFLGHKWYLHMEFFDYPPNQYILGNGICNRCGEKKIASLSEFKNTGAVKITGKE